MWCTLRSRSTFGVKCNWTFQHFQPSWCGGLQDIFEYLSNMDDEFRKRLIRLVADRLRQLCKGLVVLANKPPAPRVAPPAPRCCLLDTPSLLSSCIATNVKQTPVRISLLKTYRMSWPTQSLLLIDVQNHRSYTLPKPAPMNTWQDPW